MRRFLNPAGRRFLIGQTGVVFVVVLGTAAGTWVAARGTTESSTITSDGVDAVTAGILPSVVALLQVIAVWPPRVSAFEHRTNPWTALKLVQVRHLYALAISVAACAAVPGVARLVAELNPALEGFPRGADSFAGDGAVVSGGAGSEVGGLGLLVLRNVVVGMIIGSVALGTGWPGAVVMVAFPAFGVLTGVPEGAVDWYLHPPGSPEVMTVIAAQVVVLLVVAMYRMVYRR